MTTFKPDKIGWRVGHRVLREDTEELGTIVEASAKEIKVKWDGGRTSYFKREQPSNVRLMYEGE